MQFNKTLSNMKSEYIYIVVFLMSSFLGVSSCSSEPNSNVIAEPETEENTETPPVLEERKGISLSASQKAVTENLDKFNYAFTTDVIRYVDSKTTDSGSNVVCSPLGCEMVMSMLLNGLGEKHQNEFVQYLKVTDIESLNSLNSILIEKLPKADNATTMNLANALWWNLYKTNGLNPYYTSVFSNTYFGIIYSGDFYENNKSVLEEINKWGTDKTNGKISEYLKELNAELYAVLLNAMYFNSYWSNELFSSIPTTKEMFHGVMNDTMVDMMHSTASAIKIGEDEEAYYISLPYGNCAYEMNIIVPKHAEKDKGLNDIISLNRINKLSEKAQYRLAKINMPKLNIESRLSLSDILMESGMTAWRGILDFTMFDELKSGVIKMNQALTLSVDEKGTEASAITGIYIDSAPDPDSSIEHEILELTLDHPFYFFIQEFSTKAMIMSGRISNL